MKKIFILSLLIISLQSVAQKTYHVLQDGNNKAPIYKGLISKEVLQYDSAFKWFDANSKNYTPNVSAIDALKNKGNKIQIVAFGGTWCEDTQNILPKFFQLITAAGFNQANLTLWGVDRAKTTYGALTQAFGVTNVPTFIIMQNGKELGRVVEYGKTGVWDKELGDIINTAQ
jgi:thiol-disulfide isomerase/thioredoxin